jgi:hypothetical protein
MADVEVAIRFWWESCANPIRVSTGLEVGIDNVVNKIRGFIVLF